MPDRITDDQATDVLKIASVYDGRKASELQSTVWAADLGDHGITAEEAARAVREHYTERPDVYVKPGHVIAIAREWVRARNERERTAEALAIEPDRPTGAEAAAVHARLRRIIADAVAAKKARDAAAQGIAADLAPSDGGWNFRPVEGGGWYSGPDPHPGVTPEADRG